MKNTELLDTSQNVENTDNKNLNYKEENTQTVTREEVENTPFEIIGTEQGYFLAMGNNRLTEFHLTVEELLVKHDLVKDFEGKAFSQTNWNFLTTVIATIINKINEIEKHK